MWDAPTVGRARALRQGITLSCVIVATALLFERITHPTLQRLHLGAEYFHVARALADGRGFSDPFGEATGPTAWMPPVFPMLLAALLRVFGSKNAAASGVTVLMITALVVQGITVQVIARRCLKRLSVFAASAVFFGWIVTFYYWFFLLTSDIWVISLFICFLTLAIVDHVETGRVRPVAWAVLGGIGVLASPTFGVAWGCLVLFLFVTEAKNRRRWAAVLALAGVLASPWVVRNALVFHRFIPTKSNLPFEEYQANVLDTDGVYEISSMLEHPYNSENMRFEYQQLGEIAFVDSYGKRFRKQLALHPQGILRRVLNRALAATVNYIPLSDKMDPPLQSFVLHVVYALPFLIFVSTIWLGGPHQLLLRTLGVFWLAYLLPFVTVAFYARYFLPLTTLLTVTSALGIDRLCCRWSQLRSPAPSTSGPSELVSPNV